MYDPRWDDVRERDDGRARVYDERDPADHDPRDGLLSDLDLSRGEARELVVDRDRCMRRQTLIVGRNSGVNVRRDPE